MRTSPHQHERGFPARRAFHAVGRTTIDVVDHGRRDVYAGDPTAVRELPSWVWYPAAPDAGRELAEHVPAAWTPIADQLGLDTAGLRTHAIVDAPAALGSPHPVLIMSPSGFSPLLLAAVAEELASFGYVVVGVNHTYEAAVTVLADGRVVAANSAALAGVLGPQTGPHDDAFRQRGAVCEYKAADLRSVADQLGRLGPNGAGLSPDHLDLGRLGAFGHSFGGNAALEWCAADPRCLAAANLDGAIWTKVGTVGLPRPALQVLADHPEFDLPSDVAVAAGVSPDAAWYEAERAIVHADGARFASGPNPESPQRSPEPATWDSWTSRSCRSGRRAPWREQLAATRIDPELMWRITCDLLLAFFGEHVAGACGSGLDTVEARHPEVTIVTGRAAR